MENGYTLPLPRREPRAKHHSIVGPAILILLGILFLAQNLGLAGIDVWLTLWRLWPIFLVLVGIDLFFRGRSWTNLMVIALLVVAGFVTVAVTLTTSLVQPAWSGVSWLAASATTTERATEELNGAPRATIDLRHNAGRLSVGNLPASSNELYNAELSHPEHSRIERQIERRAGVAEVSLRDANDVFPLFAARSQDDWTIKLSPNIPLDLQVSSGASELDLDLRELMVTRLDIQAGATRANVTLPERARQTSVRVRTGAAGVVLTVPEGVAAWIHAKGGLNRIAVDETRFPKIGQYYESPDYYTSDNRVDIELASGVSDITVR